MITKIVSGGQTGADRAALDVAIAIGIPHGGWCPKGRLAEDGTIDPKYHLNETPASEYSQRTEWNVRDSDATVIFSIKPILDGGSKSTAELAQKLKKPWLHLSAEKEASSAVKKLSAFFTEYQIRTLNVAGPRLSEEPCIAEFVTRVLEAEICRRGRGPRVK